MLTQTKPNDSKPTSANFFSSGLRQKVDQLMNILWAGGVNNPMDSIEQCSYLLFLRLLTEKDETLAALDKKYPRIFSGKWSRFAWGNFVTLTGDSLFNAVRDAIEHLHELPGLSETGRTLFSRATLKIYDRPTLRAVIQGIHELDLAAHEGRDFKGDMYEYKKDHLAIEQKDLPAGWKVMRLGSIIEEVNIRAGSNHSYPVLSVTKHNGFVQSSTYFKKRVFSEDTSDYKVVERGQFAYSTIHLDEGAIGHLDKCDSGVISPMYKVFRLKVAEDIIYPDFLFRVLKSAAFMEKYRTLGKGSIKRRKSVSFEKFANIFIWRIQE